MQIRISIQQLLCISIIWLYSVFLILNIFYLYYQTFQKLFFESAVLANLLHITIGTRQIFGFFRVPCICFAIVQSFSEILNIFLGRTPHGTYRLQYLQTYCTSLLGLPCDLRTISIWKISLGFVGLPENLRTKS